MSEVKFSNGPWTPCMCNNDDMQVTFFGVVISGVYHQIGSGNENRANAHLIAAAPEMYEAMQEFVDRVDRGEVRSTATYNKFNSILAKARGEHDNN